MLSTCARRGAIGGTALAVGLAGLTIGQGPATASPPLPVAAAGPVALWGPGPTAPFTMPAPTPAQASQAYTKVVANGSGSAIALTADGRVEQIGTNPFAASFPSVNVPTAALDGKTVVDIAGDNAFGAGLAVTSTGEVHAWGQSTEPWWGSVEEMQGSTAAAMMGGNRSLAAVVKQDGSVAVFGSLATTGDFGQLTPPALTDATDVFFSNTGKNVFALKSDGTLAAWGQVPQGMTDLPAVTTDATDEVDVVDLASISGSAVALLSDGSLAAWGPGTEATRPPESTEVMINEPPASTDGKEIVALAGGGTVYFAVDSTGAMHLWGEGTLNTTTWPAKAAAFSDLPDDIDPANITGLSANTSYIAAIEATFSSVAKPAISGTAKVGRTLTATPATFTNDPDAEPTGQWYRGSGAEAEPIDGETGTTYQLTVDDLGEVITYRSTATRGTATATAESDPTAEVTKEDSTTTVSAPATTYGHGTTVTVTVTNGTTGNVTLTGAGATQVKALSGGKAVFAVPATLGAGSHALTASYAGASTVAGSTGRATLSVAKTTVGPVTVKVKKKLNRKKRAKATVIVAAPAGLAAASGRVTVTLKLGKKTKRAFGTVANGVARVKLPKLPKKGMWKVTAVYGGNANYLPASSATVKVRVK